MTKKSAEKSELYNKNAFIFKKDKFEFERITQLKKWFIFYELYIYRD